MASPLPTFKPGDTVRHCRRGSGTVSTVAINPVTHRPSKVVVDFGRYVVVCWPDDLALEGRAPPPATPRPTLTVVA